MSHRVFSSFQRLHGVTDEVRRIVVRGQDLLVQSRSVGILLSIQDSYINIYGISNLCTETEINA